jgi:hypothetical protein
MRAWADIILFWTSYFSQSTPSIGFSIDHHSTKKSPPTTTVADFFKRKLHVRIKHHHQSRELEQQKTLWLLRDRRAKQISTSCSAPSQPSYKSPPSSSSKTHWVPSPCSCRGAPSTPPAARRPSPRPVRTCRARPATRRRRAGAPRGRATATRRHGA